MERVIEFCGVFSLSLFLAFGDCGLTGLRVCGIVLFVRWFGSSLSQGVVEVEEVCSGCCLSGYV